MDCFSGLKSILPFLPISISTISSSSLSHLAWPEEAESSLKNLKLGPTVSHVDSGAKLFDFISKLRDELGFSSQPPLSFGASNGFSIFFDQHMSRDDAKAWFDEVIPDLASLLLRLPSLLEAHYHKSNELSGNDKCELRILGSQDAGIVILNRELIAGLLACAFLCLFPTKDRDSKHLPMINFDQLFVTLVNGWRQSQHEKVKCFVHYFGRICKDTPNGVVSFERKVLPSSPDAEFWKSSDTPLCPIKIFTSGSIEDQPHEALEVIFSNEKFGGNSLNMGCVQEHIRFMINPELVGGMLFMASMGDNEAVEVVGVERYAQYTGYGSSFCFSGEYVDKKPVDSMEIRKTRIVAIDALNKPSREQIYTKSLLREVNKAFCGFKGSEYESNLVNLQKCKAPPEDGKTAITRNSVCNEQEKGDDRENRQAIANESDNASANANANVGIATGNWGHDLTLQENIPFPALANAAKYTHKCH
ncbi:poly(ADP-ribose) glycohydrolase 1-like protein [Carex littledalei]|uniref:poly(ADP-ribose) glycohydrolase n=1 Tax=Carex littledalei TaxID=544730 RepID=A0A833S1J5_9POAL|nr:poly(ADP-ribose) glycohydrolase 1-like protein [Carex littledalei]